MVLDGKSCRFRGVFNAKYPSRGGEKIPRNHSKNHLCAHLTRALPTGLVRGFRAKNAGSRHYLIGYFIDNSALIGTE
jgi:hypothetical protein